MICCIHSWLKKEIEWIWCLYVDFIAVYVWCHFLISNWCMIYLQGCRNGDSCYFSHDVGPSTSHQLTSVLPEDDSVDAASLFSLFPASDGSILLLDDTGFHFSSHLSDYYDPSRIICTTCLPTDTEHDPPPSGVQILWGLSHPSQTIMSKAEDNSIPWSKVKCVLWFPKLDGNGEELEEEKSLLQTFFQYMAIRILEDASHEVQVILTINNIRFSQLQVLLYQKESSLWLSSFFGLFVWLKVQKKVQKLWYCTF